VRQTREAKETARKTAREKIAGIAKTVAPGKRSSRKLRTWTDFGI
jgi:hypothetical protein